MHNIYWFRDDLRLHHNLALNEALEKLSPSESLTFIYIYDENINTEITGAARWWLKRSLEQLQKRIQKLGSELICFHGSQHNIWNRLLEKNDISSIYCSGNPTTCIESIKSLIAENTKATLHEYFQDLLIDPTKFKTKLGTPYKVFTPFYKNLLNHFSPLHTNQLTKKSIHRITSLDYSNLELFSIDEKDKQWEYKISTHWQPGELGAKENLKQFLDSVGENYSTLRDFPSIEGTSQLSPHLRFGEISVHYIWKKFIELGLTQSQEAFLRQLVWRDFSYYLLYHFPHIRNAPFLEKFNAFPWSAEEKALIDWQKGHTGYPIVDAGMRQLWKTGWMHNRVRMIVASFLTKHLLIHWQQGARWFMDTLVDADPANNTAGWQWVAGCGADAAPYFRIFNPIVQGQKFDKKGEYIKTWIPELSSLPEKYIHTPWNTPEIVLKEANIELGKTYPNPVVDHTYARERALQAYAAIKS